MQAMRLVYFADPMCSWCYGFSPVVTTLRRRYRDLLPIRVVMGGLRPGTTEPMPEKARRGLVGHWDEIGAMTGVKFSPALGDREGFVYDTDPAAVVLAGAPATTKLDLLEATRLLRQGSADGPGGAGRDRCEQGFDRAAFETQLGDESVKSETARPRSRNAPRDRVSHLIIGPNADGPMRPRHPRPDGETVVAGVDAWLPACGPRPAMPAAKSSAFCIECRDDPLGSSSSARALLAAQSERGARQAPTASVSTSLEALAQGALTWDSGRSRRRSADIAYGGPTLKSRQRCRWTVGFGRRPAHGPRRASLVEMGFCSGRLDGAMAGGRDRRRRPETGIAWIWVRPAGPRRGGSGRVSVDRVSAALFACRGASALVTAPDRRLGQSTRSAGGMAWLGSAPNGGDHVLPPKW